MRPTLNRTFGAVLTLLCLPVLTACMDTASSATSVIASSAPRPDYATQTEHFAALQKTGLSGDYAGFASHLKTPDPAVVVGELRRSFRGKPFDVYTRKSADTGGSHKRLVELRSADGRLYLFLQLDKVTGGWKIARYELGRSDAAMSAKL